MHRAMFPIILMCLALASFTRAQQNLPPGAAAPFGGEMATPPPPPVRFVVSLTYADSAIPPMSQEQAIAAVAYFASDPELRKRPDFQIPSPQPWAMEFVQAGVGTVAQIAPDLQIFVGNPVERPNGVDIFLSSDRKDKKDVIAAAAQRVVDELSKAKPPKDQRDKRIREIDERLTNLQDKLQLLQTVSRNTAELGRDVLKDRIKAAELERQRLEMELVAQRVRSDAIAKEIERIRQQSEERAHGDPVLKQLRQVVNLREEERARVKQLVDAATAPMADLAAADDKILQASIRVSEREEALRQSTNSSLLERLNAELASNMINRAEMEVRLELIRRQMPSIDVNDLDEEKLNRLTDEYRALFRSPMSMPPLYFQLEKQVMALRAERLGLMVSEVKVSEAPSSTTKPTP